MIKKNFWLLFYCKPIYISHEFKADMYSKKMMGKKYTLEVLKILKRFLNKKILSPKHEKDHPPIEERIRRIEKSK